MQGMPLVQRLNPHQLSESWIPLPRYELQCNVAAGAASAPARASTPRRTGIPSASTAGLSEAKLRVVHARRI